MAIDPRITFRDIEPSAAVESRIREQAARLERYHDRIGSCHIVVAAPHRHKHRGRVWQIRIDMTVPGGEIVVNRAGDADHAHEDVYVAIRDAFQSARRQLEDHARRHRVQDVRDHPAPLHGEIVRLFGDEGYGFIRAGDGTEVYFHRHALPEGAWSAVDVGTEVRYTAVEGEKGLHALSVSPA